MKNRKTRIVISEQEVEDFGYAVDSLGTGFEAMDCEQEEMDYHEGVHHSLSKLHARLLKGLRKK